jgi:hypothetical protein
MLSTARFSGHMGQGAVVGSGNSNLAWERVRPAGPIRDAWKVACTKT